MHGKSHGQIKMAKQKQKSQVCCTKMFEEEQ